jgi:hypothetical protein
LKKEDLVFELDNWKYKLYLESITVLDPDFKEKDSNAIETELSNLWGYIKWYILVK